MAGREGVGEREGREGRVGEGGGERERERGWRRESHKGWQILLGRAEGANSRALTG